MTDNSTCESALNFTFRSDSLNRCYSKQAIVSNTVQQSPHGSGEHHQATTFTNGKDESRFLTQNYEESFHHTATIGKDSSGWNDRHRCPKAISTQIHQGIASAEAKVSSKPWHEEGWARSLREFANQPSVELLVLSDQLCSFGEVPRLSCRRGEVVVGISRTKPSIACSDGEDFADAPEVVWCVVYRNGHRFEGAIPKANLSPCGPHDFVMQVPVAPGRTLGLRGSAQTYGLEVDEVTVGGMVELWNDGCARTLPRDVIRVGDVIVAANGFRDPAGMLTALRGAAVVQLCIRRGAPNSKARPC